MITYLPFDGFGGLNPVRNYLEKTIKMTYRVICCVVMLTLQTISFYVIHLLQSLLKSS